MKPLYIFDLDGTLALISHRRHFVDKSLGKPNWDAFFQACSDDQPNGPVVSLFNDLSRLGVELRIYSGRSDVVRAETLEWLARNVWSPLASDFELKMRRDGDYTRDEVLKQGWLNEMSEADRHRLVCVFDDRDRVVEMWRRNGVACLQVAPGDF